MSKWTDPEVIERTFEEICSEIEKGITLRSICRREGMPPKSVFYRWIEADREGKEGRFARAQQLGNEELHDECLDIADRPSPTTENGSTDAGDVAHRKLQIWTRQQILARRDPKRYGERVQNDHQGDLTLNVTTRRGRGKHDGD